MKRVFYKCTFLEDIVLNANTATEGASPSLNYVPGPKFLGIVAKHYQDFGDDAFEIFHSGKVRFGDAHPAHGDRRSLKMPFSWCYKKTTEFKQQSQLQADNIYIHHELGPLQAEFRRDGIQLKQIRGGFFFEDGKLADVEHFFALKSAYEVESRRAKEGMIYGYDALCRGSEWIFYIEAENESLMQQISRKITGIHSIGRSRSAQYGKVKIDKLDSEWQPAIPRSYASDKVILYAESSWTFVDEYGEPTLQPRTQDLKLPATAQILWQESQIRPRIFAPWNSMRATRDNDRICIDKGSVLVVKVGEDFDLEQYSTALSSGVGIYRNEGMGQVLLNPQFLIADKEAHPRWQDISPAKIPTATTSNSIVAADDSDANVQLWLQERTRQLQQNAEITKAVNDFIEQNKSNFGDISASQWGAVRAQAQISANYKQLIDNLFKEGKEKGKDAGFLMHGKMEKLWQKRGRRNVLQQAIISIKEKVDDQGCKVFLIKLCAEMAKNAKEERNV